jgi:hypothetical protein
LEDTVARLGDEMQGVKFAICEVLTNPPAHLAPNGEDFISWHFVFDGPKVTVERGRIADADMTAEADYATILPAARTVYSENPEALEASRKRRAEAGTVALPPQLAPALAGLHDHLARRTL